MLLDEISKHLVDNSIGTVGTNLFKGFMPDTPNTLTAIYEYSGTIPQHRFGSSTPAFEKPRMQIVCRSTDYQTARNKAEDIYTLLMGVANETLKPSTGATGTTYYRVEALQSPFSLGQDENARQRVACNYEVWKGLST